MSRSGYTEDYDEGGGYSAGLCEGNVKRATNGKRGQVFFRELLAALDAMPDKRLIRGELEEPDGAVCALGALRKAKGVSLAPLIGSDWDALGEAFNVAPNLAQEVMFNNDDDFGYRGDETPEERWSRMRDWAATQIRVTPEELLASDATVQP